VAMAHVEGWQKKKIGASINAALTDAAPTVTVDALRYWTPSKDKEVDFAEVRQYILDLRGRGFDIEVVSFDQWESSDMKVFLQSYGMNVDKLSIKKPHYQNFLGILMDERLQAPQDETAIEELLQLRQTKNDKIDHQSTGYNDISDALCGAIYQAVTLTERDYSDTIEIKTIKNVRQEARNEHNEERNKIKNLVEAPKKAMPNELASYLTQFRMI